MAEKKIHPAVLSLVHQYMSLGVSPMQAPKFHAWEKIGVDEGTGYSVYVIRVRSMTEWVESQAVHMWKYYDDIREYTNAIPFGDIFSFTNEMEMLFLLRWS